MTDHANTCDLYPAIRIDSEQESFEENSLIHPLAEQLQQYLELCVQVNELNIILS